MKDDLGTRMKEQYEDRYRFKLPRRTYTIIRIDGRSFHNYTKHCSRPFDTRIHNAMTTAARDLCSDAQGSQFAFVQSDEASLLLTDFAEINTQAWFDGNIQKIVSIASSVFTASFNDAHNGGVSANFDARVFTIPDSVEVENYFIWRQKDAERNSILQTAQSMFSHNELQGKNCGQLLDAIKEKGKNWEDYPAWWRSGSLISRMEKESETTPGVFLNWLCIDSAPSFTANRDSIINLVPRYT